jgi:hypothetical protein
MGKRFVPVRDADKRAIDLHFMLEAVAELPFVEVRVNRDDKQPIFIQDKTKSSDWWTVSIDHFLTFDIEQAKEAGGTAQALLRSRKRPGPPRLPQTEIDRAVNKFFTGEDDE